MRLGTIAELAQERDVSRTRVYQWIDEGKIVRLDDGRIDLDDANGRLDALLDQTKGVRQHGNITSTSPEVQTSAQSPSTPPAGASRSLDFGDPGARETQQDEPADAGAKHARDMYGYWENKARRERIEGDIAEMKRLERAGALVSAAGVRKEAQAMGRAVRNAMLAIPDQLAPVLDPANPARAHKLLTDEIRKVLRNLSLEAEQRAAEADQR